VDYFRTYYAPNNCILVLVGDFQTRTALDSIQRYFGAIPAQTPPQPPVDSEPEQRGGRRVEVHYPAQNVSFDVGYKAPDVKSADMPVLDVVSSILSDGESSRLHQALVYEKQIALSVSTSFQTRIAPGLFECYVEMRPGKTALEGEAAVDEVIARLIKDGPTERELTKARNLLEAGFIKALKTNNGVGQTVGYYEHVFGDYREMFRAIERYHAVTADDCKRVAKQTFDPMKRTVAVLVPEQEKEAGAKP
jgi:zinc protease